MRETEKEIRVEQKCIVEDLVIKKLSTVGVLGNVALTIFKLFAGIMGNSQAMVSDALHSLSDVFATLVAYIGVKFSRKEADHDHPYGHERIESLASIILAIILFITALEIGKSGIESIALKTYSHKSLPGVLALVAAIVSIVTKEGMFWYTMHYANKLDSQAFRADAWHHRSDAISSIGALVGIGFSMIGYPIFDSIASILICMMILKVGYDILVDGINKLIDKRCDEQLENRIRQIALSQSGVLGIDDLKTREFGSKIYVDIEIRVKGDLSLIHAHGIADYVHDAVEKEFPECKHCMVHINPDETDLNGYCPI